MRYAVLLALTVILTTLQAAVAVAAPNPDLEPFPLGAGIKASALTAGPEGSLWFAGTGQGAFTGSLLGSFAPGGAVTQVPVSASPAPRGGELAVGPDGSVWFTDPTANAVGRVDLAGRVAKFPLASAGALPGAIVAGPGAAMWFVEEAAGKVGRVTMDGTLTEFALASGSRPTGIAVGPDGALWVVESGRARIARLTPSGAVTDGYSLPDPQSRPHAIVVGPGGDLWFSEESGPRVGRITAAGQVEELPIPGENGTRELALGADGNLWFTTGYAIGSISASGKTGEPECVDVGCRSAVSAIAQGPDGNLWFATESGLAGRYYAPLLSLRLGKRVTRVDDGLTTIAISCHGGGAGEACGGWLRLTAKLPRGKGRPGKSKLLLDQHRYRLEPATSRRLPLALGGRGKRALAQGKRLRVQISATLTDGSGASRSFVLQARGRR